MKILKLILALYIVHCTLYITSAQDNVYVTGGRTKVMQWKSAGDYSAYDSLLFVVVDADDERIIQKNLTKTYALGYTTMVCTLYVSDTEDLAFDASYDYDIAAYGIDTVAVRRGLFNIIDPVQTSFNGTNLPEGVRVTTISVSNGSINRELLWWNDSLGYWAPSGITFSAGGSVGNADSLGGVPAASYMFDSDTLSLSNRINLKLNSSDTTNFRALSDLKYLDKATSQTITGAKTFANLYLRDTASVFYLQGDRFLHMYHDADAYGGNLFLGKNSGNFTLNPAGGVNTLASYNVGIGENTLQSLTTGQVNTAVGYNSMMSVTTGITNTALGYRTLEFDTSGSYNTAIGYRSLNLLRSGVANIGLGYTSGYNITTGNYNTLIGYEAGYGISSGTTNTIVGSIAMHNANVTSGVALGFGAGYWETESQRLYIDNQQRDSLSHARENALIYGQFSAVSSDLQQLTINGHLFVKHDATVDKLTLEAGDQDVVIDSYRGEHSKGFNIYAGGGGLQSIGDVADSLKGSYNSAFGYHSLYANTTGNYNNAFGFQSLYNNITGSANLSLGYRSLAINTTGNNNIGIGSSSLYLNSKGLSNVAIGSNTLFNNDTASYNVAIGQGALFSNTSGYHNTAIGYLAGAYNTDDSPDSTNSTSIYIGSLTTPLGNGQENQIVIGYDATGNGSNTVTIGNDVITDTYLKGIIRNAGIDSLRAKTAIEPDTTGITDGYVKKYVSGQVIWAPDVSTSGTGLFNPDGVTIDTTAGGLARVIPSKVTKWDSVTVLTEGLKDKLDITDTTAIRTFSDLKYLENGDSTNFRTFSDLKYAATASFAIAPALLDDSLTVKMNRSEMTGYSTTSHTHTDFFDTLTITWGVLDTTYAGSLTGWKVPNDITITEISAYTDANTCTFNLEERAETTPNSAGTDVMGSDLVADANQEETSTFTNATIAKNTWLVPTISATGDVSIFSISVRYIKTD